MTAPLCPLCSVEMTRYVDPQDVPGWWRCVECGLDACESALGRMYLRVPPTVETPWPQMLVRWDCPRCGDDWRGCIHHNERPKEPPVPPDAEALVDAFERAAQLRSPHNALDYKAARAALLARLTAQPQVTVTAEKLWDALYERCDNFYASGSASLRVTRAGLAAALAALRGK